MTATVAIHLIEGYYGPYEYPLTKSMTFDFLRDEFRDDELNIIVDKVIHGYKYRQTPNIAVFEQFKDEYNKAEINKVNGNLIGNHQIKGHVLMIENPPNEEQRAAAQQMLHGLAEKMGGERKDPYDDEIVDRLTPKTEGEG